MLRGLSAELACRGSDDSAGLPSLAGYTGRQPRLNAVSSSTAGSATPRWRSPSRGLPRDEVFVTTKLPNYDHEPSRVAFVPTETGGYEIHLEAAPIHDLKGVVPPPSNPVTVEPPSPRAARALTSLTPSPPSWAERAGCDHTVTFDLRAGTLDDNATTHRRLTNSSTVPTGTQVF